MAWGRIKPEHGGAKQGKGFWGRKWEAKAASRRARRRGPTARIGGRDS